MAEVNIFSKNATYQKFEVLKTNRNKRYKYNEFLVEGVRSLNEAVKNGWKINALLYDKNNLSGVRVAELLGLSLSLIVYPQLNMPKLNQLETSKVLP